MPAPLSQPAASRAADHPASPARASGFGTTIFDVPGAAAEPLAAAASRFDVCHVGVVLRALLFVHAGVAVGVLFGAASAAGWLRLFIAGSGVALPDRKSVV